MDIVYTYRHDPLESMRFPTLLHSINSVRRTYQDLHRIYIVSSISPFVLGLTGVCWLKHPLEKMPVTSELKEQNIWNALLIAAKHAEIDSEFIWFTDDTFCIDAWDDATIRTPRFAGFLRDVPEYRRAMWPVLNKTIAAFPNGKNYVCHTPVIFNKELLKECHAAHGPLQVESVYFNHYADGVFGVADDGLCIKIDGQHGFTDQDIAPHTRFFNVAEGALSAPVIDTLMHCLYSRDQHYA